MGPISQPGKSMFAETSESVGVYDMAEEVCTEAEQSFIFVDLFFFLLSASYWFSNTSLEYF